MDEEDLIKIERFITEKSSSFALILGLVIFYNFTYASNPAIKSFLWLFSSIIIISLMCFIFFEAFSYRTTIIVKAILGLPMFLITMVFTMQVLISLFEPQNIYSLKVISQIFTLNFLWEAICTIIILGLIVGLLYIIKNKKLNLLKRKKIIDLKS